MLATYRKHGCGIVVDVYLPLPSSQAPCGTREILRHLLVVLRFFLLIFHIPYTSENHIELSQRRINIPQYRRMDAVAGPLVNFTVQSTAMLAPVVLAAYFALANAVTITDIQGLAFRSPFEGETVKDVVGTVTAKVGGVLSSIQSSNNIDKHHDIIAGTEWLLDSRTRRFRCQGVQRTERIHRVDDHPE